MPENRRLRPIIAAEPIGAGERVALNLYDGMACRADVEGRSDGRAARAYDVGDHVTILLECTDAPMDSLIVC